MHKPTLDFRSNESRRDFLKGTAIVSALALALARPVDALAGAIPSTMAEDDSSALPTAFAALASTPSPPKSSAGGCSAPRN